MAPNRAISRTRLVDHLDAYLNIRAIDDSSQNGLQVEGRARVTKIAYAVDASVRTIRAAAGSGADMLLVHHGILWGAPERIVGNLYQRLSLLVRHGVSLYAAHLPLDCHPDVGNNAELARLLGLDIVGTFAEYRGTEIGTLAQTARALRRDALRKRLERLLGTPVEMLPFGPARIGRVGLVSGRAAQFAEEAKRRGCDLFVTGESSHAAFDQAREAGINVIFGGHYATETLGVKALKRHLETTFSITGRFISAPTGF